MEAECCRSTNTWIRKSKEFLIDVNKNCVVGWKSLLSFLVRIVANHALMLLSADLIIGDPLSDCCRDRSVS